MINPIAFGSMALGVVMLLFGLFLLAKRRKAAGIAISLLGLGVAAVPFLVSFFIAKLDVMSTLEKKDPSQHPYAIPNSSITSLLRNFQRIASILI